MLPSSVDLEDRSQGQPSRVDEYCPDVSHKRKRLLSVTHSPKQSPEGKMPSSVSVCACACMLCVCVRARVCVFAALALVYNQAQQGVFCALCALRTLLVLRALRALRM